MQVYEAVNAALKAAEDLHAALVKATAAVSLLETQLCKATEGHDWQPGVLDDVIDAPCEEFSICGGDHARPDDPAS